MGEPEATRWIRVGVGINGGVGVDRDVVGGGGLDNTAVHMVLQCFVIPVVCKRLRDRSCRTEAVGRPRTHVHVT